MQLSAILHAAAMTGSAQNQPWHLLNLALSISEAMQPLAAQLLPVFGSCFLYVARPSWLWGTINQ